jgi:hypothetical protein
VHFGAYSMVTGMNGVRGIRPSGAAPMGGRAAHSLLYERELSFCMLFFWSITRKRPKRNTHPASSTLPHPDLTPEPLSSPTRRRRC